MAPTRWLQACAYIRQAMGEIGAVWGRARLMGLAPGAEVPPHVDVNYYWRTHLRIHVPIVTTPDVSFTCGGETVHMAPGECWVFDTFRWHEVHNRGAAKRVHLVMDTVGGDRLWELIDRAQGGDAAVPAAIAPGGGDPRLLFEQVNAPGIMSPWEIRCHIAFIADEAAPAPGLDQVMKRLDRFALAWTAAWAAYGPSEAGLDDYRRLLAATQQDLASLGADTLQLRNEVPVLRQLAQLIFNVALPRAPQPAAPDRILAG